MKEFQDYLDEIGEIGYVVKSLHSLVYVSGLPGAHPNEVVVFENREIGLVLSMSKDYLEVLVFSNVQIRVGGKVVRTNEYVKVGVGDALLGRLIDPLGIPLDSKGAIDKVTPSAIDVSAPNIMERENVVKPLLTGVTIIDLVCPLGKGQRELVIGDRKTGKTEFLLQTMVNQAKMGAVCIYAVIGQKRIDIKKLHKVFSTQGVLDNTIIVASGSSDAPGLIHLTPYSAMTIAEYFNNKGMDVLIILDDMTTHAKNYREISLLARRFPGRSSYPGDIFHIHAKLVERAGNFKKGSITCLPVAESILGDLSGYIQTNLMSMTDGHIFFDVDLFSQGKKPAVNPFLSVTRVGHQTQTPLQKDLGRELSGFLVTYERMKQFMHFGAEIGGATKNILSLGAKVDAFFNQFGIKTVAINMNIMIITGLWAGIWNETPIDQLTKDMEQLVLLYNTDNDYKSEIDRAINSSKIFSELVANLRRDSSIITTKLGRNVH